MAISETLKSPKVIALVVLGVAVIGVYAFMFLRGRPPAITGEQETDAIMREVPQRIARALNDKQTVTTIDALPQAPSGLNKSKDAWGNALAFTLTDLPAGDRSLVVISPGPDEKEGTADDMRLEAVLELIKEYNEIAVKSIEMKTGG